MFDTLSSLEDPGPSAGPLVRVHLGEEKRPAGASAALRLEAPPADVWPLIGEIERYPSLVRMIHRAERRGDEVSIVLRFRIALLSAKFGFSASVREEETERVFDIQYISGEPRGLRLRFELEPAAGGSHTLLRLAASYDIYSLGFLVKFFLRHHPEITCGVYPGTVLSLMESLRASVEEGRAPP